MIKVEVAYALAEQQKIITLEVSESCSIKDAIEASGILNAFLEIDINKQKVGIFGQIFPMTKILQANDRVEIYRHLIIDPMVARRNRAEEQAKD